MIGTKVGDWLITEEVGDGGHAFVFKGKKGAGSVDAEAILIGARSTCHLVVEDPVVPVGEGAEGARPPLGAAGDGEVELLGAVLESFLARRPAAIGELGPAHGGLGTGVGGQEHQVDTPGQRQQQADEEDPGSQLDEPAA